MEPKNEEELESVYDKMMTPVPVKGLDPKTPRQVIACPQSRETKDGMCIGYTCTLYRASTRLLTIFVSLTRGRTAASGL